MGWRRVGVVELVQSVGLFELQAMNRTVIDGIAGVESVTADLLLIDMPDQKTAAAWRRAQTRTRAVNTNQRGVRLVSLAVLDQE